MPTVRLPNGIVAEVDDEVAAQLQLHDASNVGTAHVLTDSEKQAQLGADTERAAFSTPGQKALAFAEGAGSGLTFGLVDHATDDYSTRMRAKHAGGFRAAGEITGMVLPAALTAGGSLGASAAKFTAGGIATQVAERAALKVGSSVVRRGMVRGAVEGLAGGVQQVVSHAALSDDPTTIEGTAVTLGLGTIVGSAIGGVAGGLQRAGQKANAAIASEATEKAAARTASEASDLSHAAQVAAEDVRVAAAQTTFHGETNRQAALKVRTSFADLQDDLRRAAGAETAKADEYLRITSEAGRGVTKAEKAAMAERDALIARADKALKGAEKYETNAASVHAKRAPKLDPAKAMDEGRFLVDLADGADGVSLDGLKAAIAKGDASLVAKETAAAVPSLKGAFASSVKDVDAYFNDMLPHYAAAQRHAAGAPVLDKIKTATAARDAAVAIKIDDIPAVIEARRAKLVADSLPPPPTVMREAAKGSLDTLPETVGNLAKMRRESAERMDALLAGGGVRADNARQSVREMATLSGIETDSVVTLRDHLRNISTSRRVIQRPAVAAAEAAGESTGKRHGGGIFRRFIGASGYSAARAAGGGHVVGVTMSALAGGAAGRVRDFSRHIAAKVFEPLGRGVARSAGPIASQYRREYADGDRRDLRDVVNDHRVAVAADTVGLPDASFRALQPLLDDGNGRFASAMQRFILTAQSHLAASIPKDPGTAMIGNTSNYRPSQAEAIEFAERRLAVDDPMGTLERNLLDGRPSQVQSQTLFAVYPTLMAEMQSAMIQEMAVNPNTIPRERRAAVTAFLKIPYDSLDTKENRAAFNTMYGVKKDPAQSPQPSRPPGRPPATDTLVGRTISR